MSLSHRFLASVATAVSLVMPLGSLAYGAEGSAPKVIASIAPVQSLAAALMEGVGEVQQLVPTGSSPHTYALKPSETAALADADVVFWVGPGLETFLPRVLDSVPRHAKKVELAEAAGVEHLPLRQGGVWGQHHHDDDDDDHDGHEGHDEHEHHDEGGEDQHMWTNPQNARAWVAAMAAALSEADPSHADHYHQRAVAVDASLQALDAELKTTLAPVQKQPYLVFHDAYQHLEKRYGLDGIGALTIDPGQPMGAKHLAELRQHIQETGARCIFAEPQFSDRLPKAVAEGSPAKVAVLDPLGRDIPPGPDHYFQAMRQMAGSLRSCLEK